jgi:hypothetical protein
MFNQNIPNIFLTNPGPGLGTSIYLVQSTGVIRAKTNANELHVRPGKNIYFIRTADIDFLYAVQNPSVTYNANGFFIYNTSNFGIRISVVPDATYNTPVDMYLGSTGTYSSGVHIGHQLTNAFNGTCPNVGTFTIGEVIQRITAHVNDTQSGDFNLTANTAITI